MRPIANLIICISISFLLFSCACTEPPLARTIKISNTTGHDFSNVVLIFEWAQGKGTPEKIEKQRVAVGMLAKSHESGEFEHVFEIQGYHGVLTGGCYYDDVRIKFDGYDYLLRFDAEVRKFNKIKVEFTNFIADSNRLNNYSDSGWDYFKASEY